MMIEHTLRSILYDMNDSSKEKLLIPCHLAKNGILMFPYNYYHS